jgi:hypothetical protein
MIDMDISEIAERLGELRKPFPPEAIGTLPKKGFDISFVGHAAVTDRLLEVDPLWDWEPLALAADGAPMIRTNGKTLELWGTLTVLGVTRTEVGTCETTDFETSKQLVSDFLCRAAMRFGVALDLWSKDHLESQIVVEPPWWELLGWATEEEYVKSLDVLRERSKALGPDEAQAMREQLANWNVTPAALTPEQALAWERHLFTLEQGDSE